MSCTGPASSTTWITSQSFSRCRTSATASGSMRSMTRAPTNSRRSASNTAPSPASTWWSARTGRVRRRSRHHGGVAIFHDGGRLPFRAFSWTTRRRITTPSSRCSVRSSSTRCREFDGKMKTKDWSKLPHFPAPKSSGKGETKWVNPETFFDELPAVMKSVPPLPGEEALYDVDRQCAGGGGQGPGDQEDAEGNRRRGRARDDRHRSSSGATTAVPPAMAGTRR